MQTTLLGFAIGIILALLAALVGPLFIDWNDYRARFEAEAGKLVGLPVRVGGTIEVSLLPNPSLLLQRVEIGRPGEDALRARTLGIEFSLGALVRGQLRATQMRVAAPELTVSFDGDGRAALPAGAIGFDANALSVERLSVEDARLVIVHPGSSERLVFEKLWFSGEVRSLAGSFRGEGAFVTRRELYGYRISASRQEGGGIRIRFNADPSERALAVEGEGVVAMDGGIPRFEGGLTLSRPVGIGVAAGRTVVADPWRLTSRVKAGALSTSFEQIEFHYGAEERALKLTGSAALKLDREPRLEGAMSATQLDIDRLVVVPGEPRRPPLAAMRAFAEKFAGVLRPAFPVRIAINVDAMTLGGSPIQSFKGEVKTEGGAWLLDAFELRAPGFTQLQFGGRLDFPASGFSFSGPASMSATDPRLFFAWLEGREEAPSTGTAKPLRARGDIVLGSERMAVERLNAEIDRKTIAGRLSYAWPRDSQKARFDAVLNAAELDLDGMIGFARTALGSAKFDRPAEISLALDIGKATIAGFEAQNTAAKLKWDAEGLSIERLSLGDFGGMSLEGRGRIDISQSPRGSVTVDLDARDMSGVSALIGRFAPSSLRQVQGVAARLGTTKLRASLDVGESGEKGKVAARMRMQGRAGGTVVDLRAETVGDFADLAQSQIRIDGNLESGDGALWRLLGIDAAIAPSPGAARISIAAEGLPGGDMRVESSVASELVDAGAKGSLRLWEEGGPKGKFDLAITRANLGKFARFETLAGDRISRTTFASHVVIDGRSLSFGDLTASFGETALRGRAAIEIGSPLRVDADIESPALDAAAIVSAAIGLRQKPADAGRWTEEPFAAAFPDMSGKIALKSARFALSPSIAAEGARASLRFAPSEIAMENIEGVVSGGKFEGAVVLRRSAEGVSVKARVSLQNADATIASRTPAVQGRFGLRAEFEGTGLSPKALIGSLNGTGTLSLERARLQGLDPSIFGALTRAADQGMPIESARVRDMTTATLDAGRLDVAHADGILSIAGGQARLSTMTARAEGADIAMSGSLDLLDGFLDAKIVMTGPGDSDPAVRPEVSILLRGDVSAPKRTVDVAAFAGWLALRAVEQQSKKLEAIERGRAIPRDTTQSIAPPVPAPNIVLPRPRPAEPVPAHGARPQERAAPLPPAIEIGPVPGARRPAQVPPAQRTFSPPG